MGAVFSSNLTSAYYLLDSTATIPTGTLTVTETDIDFSLYNTVQEWTTLSVSDSRWIQLADDNVWLNVQDGDISKVTGIQDSGCTKVTQGLAPVFLTDPPLIIEVRCNIDNLISLPPSMDYNGFPYTLTITNMTY